jgi:hypothetical protein
MMDDVATRLQAGQLRSRGLISIRGQGIFTLLQSIQTGSKAYPVCYSMGTRWGSLPVSKAAEA